MERGRTNLHRRFRQIVAASPSRGPRFWGVAAVRGAGLVCECRRLFRWHQEIFGLHGTPNYQYVLGQPGPGVFSHET